MGGALIQRPWRRPLRPDTVDSMQRPDAIIDDVAAATWQAYNAMETTKRRHFALLEMLDTKRRETGCEPSDEETRQLAWLLADHDAQVHRFTAASGELKAADAAAHRALFDYIGQLSRLEADVAVADKLGSNGAPHAH